MLLPGLSTVRESAVPQPAMQQDRRPRSGSLHPEFKHKKPHFQRNLDQKHVFAAAGTMRVFCYAMSGTDLAYAATRSREPSTLRLPGGSRGEEGSGSIPPIMLRPRYAMSGTDLWYAAARSTEGGAPGTDTPRYCPLSAYAAATQCPVVLIRCTALPDLSDNGLMNAGATKACPKSRADTSVKGAEVQPLPAKVLTRASKNKLAEGLGECCSLTHLDVGYTAKSNSKPRFCTALCTRSALFCH
eukprot:279466-Rhodomonas_salina.2